MNGERKRLFAQIGAQFPHLADDTVWAVGYLLRDYIINMISDNQSADMGCGLGEFCVDFQADGKACRVVVSLPKADSDGGGV